MSTNGLLYASALREARKLYIRAKAIGESTFWIYQKEELAKLKESQPARAAFWQTEESCRIGKDILDDVIARHLALVSEFDMDESADADPVLKSFAWMEVALEMASRQLDSYKAALIHSRLVNEISPDDYSQAFNRAAEIAEYLTMVSTKTAGNIEWFFAQVEHRSAL